MPGRPLEAHGTGGRKTMINGAINFSVLDRWWADGYDSRNGFAIGSGSEHAGMEHQGSSDAQSFRDILEKKVVL